MKRVTTIREPSVHPLWWGRKSSNLIPNTTWALNNFCTQAFYGFRQERNAVRIEPFRFWCRVHVKACLKFKYGNPLLIMSLSVHHGGCVLRNQQPYASRGYENSPRSFEAPRPEYNCSLRWRLVFTGHFDHWQTHRTKVSSEKISI